MTETIKLPDYYEPDWKNARYGSLEELKELLLFKRIVKWDKDFNQNPVAIANCEAEHNGYYYSVCSLVIGDIHFPVVNA
ncbi:Uncharacterised protein [Streptococcus pneumoniae]|nr:Uncharacterised protein [Streptococcus pneumoniae]VOZ26211.1 Uncharacterised protein [Streptococcus pneumoniae]VPA09507.1 Uncharacterised protein [Streptococcus pneumoniae]VRL63852.1 Uncharacterised protein [Streptococcus pneumoniae]VSG25081.1 Uncharacterised protein [Streptococcus pneumoniae]